MLIDGKLQTFGSLVNWDCALFQFSIYNILYIVFGIWILDIPSHHLCLMSLCDFLSVSLSTNEIALLMNGYSMVQVSIRTMMEALFYVYAYTQLSKYSLRSFLNVVVFSFPQNKNRCFLSQRVILTCLPHFLRRHLYV